MKLVENISKYKYEIESNYKIGDKVIFTNKCVLCGRNGVIVGIVGLQNSTDYIVRYDVVITAGAGNISIFSTGTYKDEVFTEEQIKLK